MAPILSWIACNPSCGQLLPLEHRRGLTSNAVSKSTRNQGLPLQRKRVQLTPTATPIQCTQRSPEPTTEWVGKDIDPEKLVSQVKFNDAGLVPAIAQQWDTGEVLMMAWMSAESIRETMRGGRAVYYSRSRKQLWRKGDTSGQIQVMRDLVLDCDGDTILVKVEQLGVACHTGRRSCFYTAYRPPLGDGEIIADVLMDPKELYKPA